MRMNKTLSKDEIQSCCLDILKQFDSVCRANDLTYWAAGGTLLGAVRHQGFIPWDDDVDLMMPRPDYEKFIRLFSSDELCLSCCYSDDDYKTPFIRLWNPKTRLIWRLSNEREIGVFIDIFPIDGFPNNSFLTALHFLDLKFNRALLNASTRTGFKEGEKFIPIKRFMSLLVAGKANKLAKRQNRVAMRYSFDRCENVGVKATGPHLLRENNPKSLYMKTVYLKFEDMSLPVPGGYIEYLIHLYGDYMQLPPIDQRNINHDFDIYWITD